MAEYIEREALLKHIDIHCGYCGEARHCICEATAADVVEVVRCRDCKSYCPESITVMKYCVLTGVSVDANDFCSYGERKDTDVH